MAISTVAALTKLWRHIVVVIIFPLFWVVFMSVGSIVLYLIVSMSIDLKKIRYNFFLKGNAWLTESELNKQLGGGSLSKQMEDAAPGLWHRGQ